jgi:hypothetical protein
MERASIYLFLGGLALAAIGLLWFLVAAFRTKWWWGLGVILLPPLSLFFLTRHGRKVEIPLVLMLLGGAVAAVPPAYSLVVPIDLGPRERIVDGELHLTLTGWDRKDYSVLKAKPKAVVLQMANPDVTDATLKHLGGMDGLRELDLNDSQVTDAGLKALEGLAKLETLRLRNTKVTDAGFAASLAPREALRQLDLRGTRVSREAVKAWRDAKAGRRAVQ